MAIRFLLLILIAFLSRRECFCPIKFRQWCRIAIGVFPLRIIQSGFLCFNSDFFSLQLHRDHDFDFSKTIMDFQNQIWDPGDSNQKVKMVEHNYGLVIYTEAFHVLVREMVISAVPCSKRLILLVNGTITLSFVRETLVNWKSNTRDISHSFDDVRAIPQFVAFVHVYFDGGMVLWLHQFVLYGIPMTRFYVVLVILWRQDLIGIEHNCWKRKALVMMFDLESINRRRSGTWHDSIKLYMALLKRITETLTYFGKTLVQNFWCHCVYILELYLGTSSLALRFVKRHVSHKLLHTNRNKAKSNMKLENNGPFDPLASKATLRKHRQTPFCCISLSVWHIHLRM